MRSVICMETRSGYPVNKNTERKKKKPSKVVSHSTIPRSSRQNITCIKAAYRTYMYIVDICIHHSKIYIVFK